LNDPNGGSERVAGDHGYAAELVERGGEQELIPTADSDPTLARWPGDQPRDTVWRTPHGGVARGLLTIRGAGTKKEAFRYALKNLPANPATGNPPDATP